MDISFNPNSAQCIIQYKAKTPVKNPMEDSFIFTLYIGLCFYRLHGVHSHSICLKLLLEIIVSIHVYMHVYILNLHYIHLYFKSFPLC